MTDAATAAEPAGDRVDDPLVWGHTALRLEVSTGPDGVPRLARLEQPGAAGHDAEPAAFLPLLEVTALGHGTGWSGPRFTGTALNQRMRRRAVRAGIRDGWHFLDLDVHDPASGLAATVELSSPDGVPVLRSRVRLRNDGTRVAVVQSVSSLLLGGLPPADALEVHRARNDWLAEGRWYAEPLRGTVADIGVDSHQHDSRATLALAGRGSWPTDGHLAAGALTDGAGGRAWAWQVESPAGWRWDIGEYAHGCHLTLHGPADADHQWRQALAPGEEFTTVPVAVALGSGFEDAIAALTTYRRAVRRAHPDHTALPVVFNDYMNTLMGDPTTAKLVPLIDAAAQAGAEYFCIDSGWYDDDLHGWWDSVGEWLPSSARFPGGIQVVLDHIRDLGMVPGLWLEPEVVGVRSPVAKALPDDAFFQQDGVRITEQGRHQLDLRHPAARAHLDATVDRIVGAWGVGYLKLDYNIVVAPGTQGPGDTSPGAGLLGHARAYLDWIAEVLDRHPGLVIENCASGGMRMDGASLAVTQLQSTSDQQDPLRYPPITVAAPTAMPPEQCAVWAYPQPEFTDDEITFALAGALLGRVHLSGRLDRMSPHQLALVGDAMAVYKRLRADLPRALPFWPLGLPGWSDDWLSLGMRVPEGPTYLLVWRRQGTEPRLSVPVRHLAGRSEVAVGILHPRKTEGEAVWDAGGAAVGLLLPRTPAAVLLRLDPVS
ncbi:alpha-galactosidase [Streptomyces cocklensis]|nr:glycoside hydrolase family 36 protein [Actinacidiphila cocklensis]MDD1059944.1 alpha-galactosidase [Actinacidiphila cocklensis]